jgi:hypothetical protein
MGMMQAVSRNVALGQALVKCTSQRLRGAPDRPEALQNSHITHADAFMCTWQGRGRSLRRQVFPNDYVAVTRL